VGLGDGVGRYQAGDASQGLFLILQAMREIKMAGCGTAFFGGHWERMGSADRNRLYQTGDANQGLFLILMPGPILVPEAVCIVKTPFCNEQLWIRLFYL
jgi:hypothetical protein